MADILCPNCGRLMYNIGGHTLHCSVCDLILDDDEIDDWDDIYPTYEELMGIEEEDDDDSGEKYEEVYDELHRD